LGPAQDLDAVDVIPSSQALVHAIDVYCGGWREVPASAVGWDATDYQARSGCIRTRCPISGCRSSLYTGHILEDLPERDATLGLHLGTTEHANRVRGFLDIGSSTLRSHDDFLELSRRRRNCFRRFLRGDDGARSGRKDCNYRSCYALITHTSSPY
jgi:hypothetical protein